MADLVFSIVVVVVAGIAATIALELWELLTSKKIRLQFRLVTLLALMTTIGLVLGVHRMQTESPMGYAFPFLGIALACTLLVGLILALCNDLVWPTSTLDEYRQSHTPAIAAPTRAGPKEKSKPHRKWWLRRIPNRFRSISHRDFQDTPSSGYYTRD
ncbi:MAG: hypothetical protein KDA41_04090 [Planctomycetales bacterium]|nr:hypothetical protein [Planctomycetales bacterium]